MIDNKEILLVSGEDKLRLNTDDFQKYVQSLNPKQQRIIKVAEQKDLTIYKLVTYSEWIRAKDPKKNKTQSKVLKVFYVGINITKNDFDTKIKKIQDNLIKGKQIKVIIKKKRGPLDTLKINQIEE